ncbi:MAG: type II secretion system protein [Rhodocyclaceae bacterium]|nr:type II secretion system protein [Rhodocyclaceae bacterium]
MFKRSPPLKRSSGFSLTELAISLAIIALVLVLFLGASGGFISTKRGEITQTKLKAIETAIALYVAQNKRLPCPADGAIPAGTANSGAEDRNAGTGDCNNSQNRGVVPALTLGISEADATDGWNNRITYRVYSGGDGSLTRNNAMDMSGCDPAGTAAADGVNKLCKITCTTSTLSTDCVPPINFLQGKGLEVRDASGINKLMDPATSPSTGAAYILISHGDNLIGGYTTGGTPLAANGPGLGTQEAQNSNGVNWAPGNYFVDAPYNGSDTTNHFDDYVVRPSIMSVVNKAQLGPRAH